VYVDRVRAVWSLGFWEEGEMRARGTMDAAHGQLVLVALGV